jgi:hypothetical protein
MSFFSILDEPPVKAVVFGYCGNTHAFPQLYDGSFQRTGDPCFRMRKEFKLFDLSFLAVQAVQDVDVQFQIKLLSSVRRSLYSTCPRRYYCHIGRPAASTSQPPAGKLLNYAILFICVAYMLKSGNSLAMVQKTGGHKYTSVLVDRDIFHQSTLSSLHKG